MTAKKYSGPERRLLPSAQRSVIMSVVSSLIVAVIVNCISFILTVGRLSVTMDNIERRVAILEMKSKEDTQVHRQLEVSLTRYIVLLERISIDVSSLSKDFRFLEKKADKK